MTAMIAAGALGNWLGERALHRTSEILQLVLTLLAAPALGCGADMMERF
jgi:hypothetical protein